MTGSAQLCKKRGQLRKAVHAARKLFRHERTAYKICIQAVSVSWRASVRAVRHDENKKAAMKIKVISRTMVGAGALSMKKDR